MSDLEERVDELIAIARDAGRAAADLARAERDVNHARPGDQRPRRTRADARKHAQHMDEKLTLARARFLKAGTP